LLDVLDDDVDETDPLDLVEGLQIDGGLVLIVDTDWSGVNYYGFAPTESQSPSHPASNSLSNCQYLWIRIANAARMTVLKRVFGAIPASPDAHDPSAVAVSSTTSRSFGFVGRDREVRSDGDIGDVGCLGRHRSPMSTF
jgi:hypothetical protein